MYKKVIYITLLIFTLSCSSDKCGEMKNKFVGALVNELECKNHDAVARSVDKVTPTNCERIQTGRVCVFMVDPIVEISMDMLVSKEWECKLTKSKEHLKLLLTAVCSAV